MSIPLPNIPKRISGNCFLDPDERFEVFQVKAAERPHLLSINDGGGESEEDDLPPPLLDGCDIPGWRQEQLVGPMSSDLQGALRIGAGSVLFRRDSQWPTLKNVSEKSSSQWDVLRRKLLTPPIVDIPRVDYQEKSQTINGVTQFALEWEQRNVPVLIEGCTVGWKAMPRYEKDFEGGNEWNGGGEGGWTFENLVERFGDISWRFSDLHGEMMPLETYAKYIMNPEGLTDDSPLGIYDSEFGDADSPTSVLLDEYTVPSCFSTDLFSYCSSESRPPYRWILIGPARSGTGLHIDPLDTNAWVTLLQGTKRWLLFPPDTPPQLIGMEEPQIPSSIWFSRYYDRVTSDDFPYAPVEVLQRPGETVFVPSTWPHLVLNLELTVAVTHNYASEHGPFEQMWSVVEREEPEFAKNWFAGLETHRPDLVERIRQAMASTQTSEDTATLTQSDR